MVYCVAFACRNKSVEGKQSFFRFPDRAKKKKQHDAWLAQVRRDNFKPTKYSCLCSDHFEPTCFTVDPRIMKDMPVKLKMMLKPDVVPTIFCRTRDISGAPVQKPRSAYAKRRLKEMTEKTHNARGRRSRKHRTERKRDVSTLCNIQIDISPSFCVKCFLRENPDFPVNDHFYHKPKSEMDIRTNGIPVHAIEDIKTETLETEPETDEQTTGTPTYDTEDIKIEILETEPETDIQTTGTTVGAIENIKMETLETEPETDVQTTRTATQMHTVDDTKIETSETDNTSILMSIKGEPSSDDSSDFNIFSASENQNMEPSSNFCTLSDHSQFPVSLLCLKTLFCMLACQICKEPFEPHATVYNCNGSGLSANLTCINGHIFSWTSLQISKLQHTSTYHY